MQQQQQQREDFSLPKNNISNLLSVEIRPFP